MCGTDSAWDSGQVCSLLEAVEMVVVVVVSFTAELRHSSYSGGGLVKRRVSPSGPHKLLVYDCTRAETVVRYAEAAAPCCNRQLRKRRCHT